MGGSCILWILCVILAFDFTNHNMLVYKTQRWLENTKLCISLKRESFIKEIQWSHYTNITISCNKGMFCALEIETSVHLELNVFTERLFWIHCCWNCCKKSNKPCGMRKKQNRTYRWHVKHANSCCTAKQCNFCADFLCKHISVSVVMCSRMIPEGTAACNWRWVIESKWKGHF